MDTKVIQLKERGGDQDALVETARVLVGGGVVLFPTETVYGLGGDGRNPVVVERIYRIKKRIGNKSLVRLIADQSEIRPMLTEAGQALLLRKYWPGPLTVILRTDGGKTRGYRLPGHDFIRRMIEESGIEMVATSANLSGEPPVTNGATACREFTGQVDLIIDGGGGFGTVLNCARPQRLAAPSPSGRPRHPGGDRSLSGPPGFIKCLK